MKADGLIFDLDGTLWDASASCVMAWNSTLQNKGVKDFIITRQMAHSFAGKLLDDIFSSYFTFLPPGQYDDMAAAYAVQEKFAMKKSGGELYPGVKNQLEVLSEKYPLFIVSNCLAGYIESFLDQHRLGNLFADYECTGITGKPKAENIELIISRNELRNAVYIGDTSGDFQAANKNNLPFIYAEYGFGDVINAPYGINNFTELEEVLKKM